MPSRLLDTLRHRLESIYYLASTLSLLFWDQEVNMPRQGADHRALTVAQISALIHEKVLALNEGNILHSLQQQLKKGKLTAAQAVIVREVTRTYDREEKLPESFVRELAATVSKAQSVWAQARQQSNFKLFAPWLKKIIALKRQEAHYVGFRHSPYDALLDVYEPDVTTPEATMILEDLKKFLVPFLRNIRRSRRRPSRLPAAQFPIDKQIVFNHLVAEKMGFNLTAGRIDVSVHPFTVGFHPADVRFTTHYDERNIFASLFATIHEAGHGLYEQGLPLQHFGTPLGEVVSTGIHESQSRLWENIVGRSRPFWHYFYPRLRHEFPRAFKRLSLEDFYRALNRVEPSLIRIEADEVTYNLHIIVRFEIEKNLIEGTIEVKDVPAVWKAKMKEYLGITVPSDRFGVLQDIHWSSGLIGYFPTYTFGNLYAAQLYQQARQELLGLESEIARGHLEHLRLWLSKKIHQHGKRYSASEIIRRATGEELNPQHFTNYLQEKYNTIYNLPKL